MDTFQGRAHVPGVDKEWIVVLQLDWGKKEAEKHGFLNKLEYIQYVWTSFGAMKRHYMKTCKSIQVCRADVEHQTLLGMIGEAYHV